MQILITCVGSLLNRCFWFETSSRGFHLCVQWCQSTEKAGDFRTSPYWGCYARFPHKSQALEESDLQGPARQKWTSNVTSLHIWQLGNQLAFNLEFLPWIFRKSWCITDHIILIFKLSHPRSHVSTRPFQSQVGRWWWFISQRHTYSSGEINQSRARR